MNIAIITPTLHYGGAEKQTGFLALGLKEKGFSVNVYCFFDDGEIADTLTGNGIGVIGLYSNLLRRLYTAKERNVFLNDKGIFKITSDLKDKITRLANEVWAAVKLFIIFLKNRPAAVHLYQNQTKMAIIVAKLCGVRKVIYTETCLIGDWLTPAQLLLMKVFWKFCDSIVVLSSAMKDHILKLKLVNRDKVHLIPTMLPSHYSDSSTDDKSVNQHIRIGTIGRLTPEKGHIFLLKAAQLINKRFSDVKFIIAGNGPLKDSLVKAATESGLGEKVDFIGRFNKLNDIMNSIDIFVLTSLTEGMPLVLVEAMAYGKPIVATDVGGVRELVKDGETGFVVPPKNPEAFAEAVIDLINQPEKRQNIARAATERFMQDYSSERLIPQIELLYK